MAFGAVRYGLLGLAIWQPISKSSSRSFCWARSYGSGLIPSGHHFNVNAPLIRVIGSVGLAICESLYSGNKPAYFTCG